MSNTVKKDRWPVIDTHCHIGVNLINTFDAEKEPVSYTHLVICFWFVRKKIRNTRPGI